MDSGEIPVETIVVSVPSSPGNVDVGVERQDPVNPKPMRKAWDVLGDKFEDALQSTTGFYAFTCLGIMIVLPILPFILVASKWKRVFILACVAISIDCLFLYIPIVDQEHTCISLDKRLRKVALVLRSIVDVAFIMHILILIQDAMDEGPKWADSHDHVPSSWLPRIPKIVRKAIAKKMPWLSTNVAVNFLAVLPIPQVAILVGFYNLGSSKHFVKQTVINVFLLLQCTLRIFQIFLSNMNLGGTVGKSIKGLFYFLLYIIASHVLASFWYFFSIQREISCWDKTCQVIGECTPIYVCGRSSLNSTSISKLCPINSSDATFFDFGIFRSILQSGNTSSTTFSAKFFYSFWWGLKNLSNFGTNLETSSYVWENCFAILISVIGLLLFLFLIGNVQTYIQSESEKFVNIRESIRRRINKKYEDLKKWMSSHDLPDDIKTDTLKNISENWVAKCIDDVWHARLLNYGYGMKDVKLNPLNFICVKALKRIPILRRLDEQELQMFYKGTFPTNKGKHSLIASAGKELHFMYLIIDGVVECYDAETMSTRTMSRYYCVGEEILRWAILNYKKSLEERGSFPMSTVDFKCQTDVEAFYFHRDTLLEIVRELDSVELVRRASNSSADQRIEEWLLRNGFSDDLKTSIMDHIDNNNLIGEENMYADVDVDFLFRILPRDLAPSVKHHLGIIALKKVPVLQKMHEYVLENMCNYLQPVVYNENDYVIRAGEPLRFMIFILRGNVTLTNMNTTTTSSSEIIQSIDETVIEIHNYYGEQLLRYVSPNNIFSAQNPVIVTRNVRCQTKVEALIFKEDELRTVATRWGSQWNLISNMNSSQHLVGNVRDTAADSSDSTSTKLEETAIQLHQGHDMMLEQLVLIRETMFQFRDDMRRLDEQVYRLNDKIHNQGQRLEEMAAFLAGSGYNDTSPAAAP